MVVLYATWHTHSNLNHCSKPERLCLLYGEVQRDCRSTPWLHFLRFESRRTPPLYFIILLSNSQPFIRSHQLPPHSKYIYYPAVFCGWAPLAKYPLLGRVQKTRRRRKRERNQSKQFCLPASSQCKTNGGKFEHSSNQYTSLLIKQGW